MKRFALIILSIILTISFASCIVISDNPNDTTPLGSKPITTGETDKPSDSTNDADDSEAETFADVEPDEIAIEETTLYDKDGVKVVAKEWIDDFWDYGIKIYLENNTEKDLTFQLNYLIVNNFMFSDFFTADVAAGKKTNTTLEISKDQLEECDISKVGLIELDMYTMDTHKYDIIAQLGKSNVKTNFYDQMDGTNGDGDVLLNQKGVKVVGRYIDEETFWGKAIVLYIESDKDVILQSCDLSINDFSINSLSSIDVLAGKKAVDSITIFDSDLKENDITEIEKIEFKFEVIEYDTYKTLYISDIITCVPNK